MLRYAANRIAIRSLHASARRNVELSKVEKLTLKEYRRIYSVVSLGNFFFVLPCDQLNEFAGRLALRMRKRRDPPCHRELIDYLTALADHDYENEHPKVVPLLRALDKCTEESVRDYCCVSNEGVADAQAKRVKKRQKPSLSYHLSRYLKR